MEPHPNIVRSFGECIINGNPHLVLEVCKSDLEKYLLENNGKVELGKARRILRQISKGMAYLREKNIVHRDLKPSNILIKDLDDLRVVIADMGLALVGVGSTFYSRNTVAAGTRIYMSPEVLEKLFYAGKIDFDDFFLIGHPADVFPFGLIAVEIVTGTRIQMVSRNPLDMNLKMITGKI